MKKELLQLKEKTCLHLDEIDSVSDLDLLKSKTLGKKGALTDCLKGLKDLDPSLRPEIGQLSNDIKTELLALFVSKQEHLKRVQFESKLKQESKDLSLPGRVPLMGTLHPIQQMQDEVVSIFKRLGYSVATGPQIESEFNNFEALNIPDDHPARDMHDTFYLNTGELLRTHTSPVQIREMQKQEAPIKIVVPGKVYRCDADVSHSPVFHQIEGLFVSPGLCFADLKGVVEAFLHEIFGAEKKIRFRPSYFPFTVPSCEVDVEWKDGWLEIMGAGMVHRNVFKSVGYDDKTITGFAFGVGIDRLAMLKYAIDDIRLLYENDLRFLRQF